jgi:hypothetical protein
MNLIEAVSYINLKYKQELIPLKEMNYSINRFILKQNPKFLYRGEKIYPTTRSNYHRLKISGNDLIALQSFILDISVEIVDKYFGIVDRNHPEYWPRIYKAGAFLQHYGFPIMWLDLTESPEVAAFFASFNNGSGKGRIWIAQTQKLIENGERIFKLDGTFARRPALQKAYALEMSDIKPDLQNRLHFPIEQINFEVTAEDRLYFENQSLLSTKDDDVSDFIIDFIIRYKSLNEDLNSRLIAIKNDLIQKKSWNFT